MVMMADTVLDNEAFQLYQAGTQHYHKSESSQSLSCFQEALDLLENCDDPDPMHVAACHNQLGLVFRDTGQLEQAVEHYRKALDIEVETAPKSLSLATSYNNLGSALEQMEDLEGALEYFQLALNIRKVQEPNTKELATSYNNVGRVLVEMGDLDGMKFYRKAKAIQKVLTN